MSTINISFPFEDSSEGEYLKLSKTSKDALKSDFLHLILTQKGERFYLPDFGTNLRKLLFEPNDSITMNDVKEEINTALIKYLPKLQVDEIKTTINSEDGRRLDVLILYTITDGVFTEREELTVVI